MGAVSTIADDEIISVPAKKRNCYFQEEYKLELHRWVMEMLVVLVIILLPRLYSQSGCVFECKMAMGRAKTIGGCTPWFYPSKGRFKKLITSVCSWGLEIMAWQPVALGWHQILCLISNSNSHSNSNSKGCHVCDCAFVCRHKHV